MISVSEYIKIILKKKQLTLKQFANKINDIKDKIGIEGRTTPQNISNFLNEVDKGHTLRPKQLCIWEKALDLPLYTLINMVAPPSSREAQKELKEIIKKVREVKK